MDVATVVDVESNPCTVSPAQVLHLLKCAWNTKSSRNAPLIYVLKLNYL